MSDVGCESAADAVHPDAFQEFIDRHGYLSWLGLTVEHAERGRVRMRVPHDEKLLNPSEGQASVHGGITATLVDTASGFALRTTFDDPAAASLTTTDLDVSYLRPATDDLTVEAETERAGDSVGVTSVTVSSEKPSGEPADVAVGRATYRLFRDS